MWQKRVNLVFIVLTSLLVLGVAVPFIQSARESARRMQSRNNLKQFGLAFYNYADTFQGLPPGGIFNEEGRGYHGWMSSILPFVDSNPFYNAIDFHKPWDSNPNAGLFLNPIPCYENPSQPALRRHWEFPVTHYSANANIMAPNSSVDLKSIENSDHVFMVGELDGDYLPWACPYNWRELDSLNSKPPIYGRSTKDGCQFLFVGGRVDFITNDVSPSLLKRMNGVDLSGFNVSRQKIHVPSAFPCPTDALWKTWKYKDHSRFEELRDIHGTLKSINQQDGK